MALKAPDPYLHPATGGVARQPTAPVRPPRFSTEWLMAGRREIVLQHGLEEYRLRITAAGKLILTK
jgi:hemin uptake protein HemP